MSLSIPPKLSASLVDVVRRLDDALSWLDIRTRHRTARSLNGRNHWPVIPGAYQVGDPRGCVAVCMLTSGEHIQQIAAIPGVAIAGRVYTANLGLEKMIQNLLANPRIRFLILAGKDSPFFQSGQAVQSLMLNGVTPEGRIIGALGHFPELSGRSTAQIENFRNQLELVNVLGETDPASLAKVVEQLVVRNPGPFLENEINDSSTLLQDQRDEAQGFILLKPGGRREPLSMDPQGFYIISLDETLGEILVHHYLANHQPAHLIRGRSGEAVLLGLLREGLVSQMSHAGYLGAELAKAETALRLNLYYEQDRPLRQNATPISH